MVDQTALDRDRAEFSRQKPSMLEYILHASQKSERSPFSLIWEFRKLARGRGRLTLQEYVQYGVYDPELSPEDRNRFITNNLHWPITAKCCDMTWQATTEDKWLCSKILEPTDVRVPATLGVIDKTGRAYPGTRKIANASEMRDFVLARQGEPFFAKENRGMVSCGAFMVSEIEPDRLHLKGEGWLEYEELMDRFVGSTSYLLQPCEKNHSFFDKYTDNLSTVRVCILAGC
jgi:hypothetical protein